MKSTASTRRPRPTALLAALWLAAGSALAQVSAVPGQVPGTDYPTSPSPASPYLTSPYGGSVPYAGSPYPGSTPVMSPYATTTYTDGGQRSARGLFLATLLGFVAQGVGGGLSQGLGGIISRWFGGAETTAAMPIGVQTSGLAGTAQPTAAPQGALPTSIGQPVATSSPTQYVAGIAYEVQVRSPDGSSATVDPASHVFRTGDRFMLAYRPSLPGRLEVSNINPRGEERRIDAAELAAGQLVTLGPYEFTGESGDEVLKVVLAPCSSPRLLSASRSIVKSALGRAGPDAVVTQAAAGLELQACGSAVALRSTRMPHRDIKNVAREGSTSFALDVIGRSEVESGALESREVRIRMAHR